MGFSEGYHMLIKSTIIYLQGKVPFMARNKRLEFNVLRGHLILFSLMLNAVEHNNGFADESLS